MPNTIAALQGTFTVICGPALHKVQQRFGKVRLKLTPYLNVPCRAEECLGPMTRGSGRCARFTHGLTETAFQA
ncbi:MAG: hypothetical protein SGJ20_10055 [Planctomycetota bacterium]|nr:hypothetical protein [Planctomycetota bacterium]